MPYIQGFGTYLPERIVTNQELARLVSKDPEWIEKACGIRERRWAKSDESVADLAVAAGQTCLNAHPASPGMLILASGSAAVGFPGPAAEVAMRLGLESIPALDVPMASAGSLFGLVLAAQSVPQFGAVLVIGAEKMSAVLEAGPRDPDTMILFGDGAGAVLLSERPGPWRVGEAALHSDGHFQADLAFDAKNGLTMNGLSVIMQASRKLPAVIQEVLTRESLASSDVAKFVLHQANQNLLTRVAKTLGVAPERMYTNIGRYGNTSSASLLIALAEYASTPAEGPIMLAAFGAGFHWGAAMLHKSV